jgi:hypothetical protein
VDKDRLSSLLADKYSEVKKYAEENHFSFKKKQDLATLLAYYERIR